MRSKGSFPRTNDLSRRPAVGDRQQKEKTKRYPGCLALLVSGMCYSVVANRRPPNLYMIGVGEFSGVQDIRVCGFHVCEMSYHANIFPQARQTHAHAAVRQGGGILGWVGHW